MGTGAPKPRAQVTLASRLESKRVAIPAVGGLSGRTQGGSLLQTLQGGAWVPGDRPVAVRAGAPRGKGLRPVSGRPHDICPPPADSRSVFLVFSSSAGERWPLTPTDPFAPLSSPAPGLLESQLSRHDQMLSVHDIRLADMDLRFQVLETASYDGVLIWKIRDYRRRKQEAVMGKTLSLYSQPFYTGYFGYKMCARVYLNGDGMGKGTHLSLFFVIMRGEYDALLPWPFKQKVTLMLMDQGSSRRHLGDAFKPDPNSSSFKKPTGEMNIASGCPVFVAQTVLENGTYIKDDTIFIKVIVDTSDLPDP